MKIGCFSLYGNFSPIMGRISQEIGRENTLIYYDKPYAKWWEGLLNKTDSIDEIQKFKPDILIFDMAGEGELADEFISAGYNVIGSCGFCDTLELDRFFGMKIFETLGFNIPETHPIKSYKEAVKFLT